MGSYTSTTITSIGLAWFGPTQPSDINGVKDPGYFQLAY